ncbi:heavy metal translocating P-type ATPase [Psychromicrobium xiongbiense]|uniref:heavy metal translocating P-type ATPase n=1 Tax=Psychromicrobium xiongbiense TaxID=3051184 RepID=UPI002555E976|nr:heavy metal translocating P-type ATPase [Psychromicrobium sp. YIM S02556]
MTKTIPTDDAPRMVDLQIQGMTCASCVARVEKKLNRIEGVQASVNLPLESARVQVPAGVSDEELLAVVRATGYGATVKSAPRPASSQPAHQGMEHGMDHHESMDPQDHMAHGGTASSLLPRLLIAAVLTIPVVLISMIPALQYPQWGWTVAVLSLPVVTWCAWNFHRAAAINARHLASTMDTLVSIGIIAAYAFSLVTLLLHPDLTASPEMAGMSGQGDSHPALYFEVAAVVTTFLLLGRYLEARAKTSAGNALKALLSLGAKEASVMRDGVEVPIPADQLQVGDRFVVRPGEKLATDGIVEEGRSAVDASLITGESMPVEVGPGDAVTGATLNTSGRLVVAATRVGSETTLAQMGRLVSDAQSSKAPIARLADRISGVFVPVVLGISVLTFLLWWIFSGDLQQAFVAAVAVLVIACPCALGLATPVALLAGTGRGAQLGILIKGPQVLEDTRTVDTIVLDKTGTVTTGRLTVAEVRGFNGATEAQVLRWAAAVEHGSEHPIAAAVLRRATQNEAGQKDSPQADPAPLPPVTDFRATPGGGVRGRVDGELLLAGTREFLIGEGVSVMEPSLPGTQVWLAVDGTLRGVIVLEDGLKPGSAAAIAQLRALGLRPLLVTGDNAAAAALVAAAIGIPPEDVRAEIRPEGKVEVVRALQAAGATVAMAGDGVNDAAALAQADLGIAMGSGTDVAIEAADLTVMGNDLGQAATAIELSRATLSTIKVNLFWAFAYNVVGLPIAALGLLNPMIAGAAMAASSVLVVANSLRLTRFGRS